MDTTQQAIRSRAARVAKGSLRDLKAIASGAYFNAEEKVIAADILKRSRGADDRTLINLAHECTGLTARAAKRKGQM